MMAEIALGHHLFIYYKRVELIRLIRKGFQRFLAL